MRRLAAAALGVLAVAVAGCSGGPRAATPTTTTERARVSLGGSQPAATAPSATAATLAVGDCVDVTDLQIGKPLLAGAVNAATCTAAHGAEVFDLVGLASGPSVPYPGPTPVIDDSTDRCISAFSAYVGSSYLGSTLDVIPVVPDQQGWNQGDRQAVCLAYDASLRPLDAPVRDSQR
jgi:Septum formation